MNTTIKYIIKLTFVLGLIFALSTCKKYPENTLWFKNPSKISPFYGFIKKYTVNGIDSLDLLNNYFGSAFGLDKNIRNVRFMTYYHGGRPDATIIFGNSGISKSCYYEYTKKNKFIILRSIIDTSIFKKILFDPTIEWQILQLSTKKPFKAKTTLENGNTYEIEIGN